MAIPTNPILINQIIAIATSLEDEDWLLLEQDGVHKKMAGINVAADSEWAKNPDDTIYFAEGSSSFVGIGGIDPNFPLEVQSSVIPALKVSSETVDGNTIVITDSGTGSTKNAGLQLGYGSTIRYTDYLDSDTDIFQISAGTTPNQFQFTPAGAFITPFV